LVKDELVGSGAKVWMCSWAEDHDESTQVKGHDKSSWTKSPDASLDQRSRQVGPGHWS